MEAPGDRLRHPRRRRLRRPVRGRSWTIDAPYRETVDAIRRHREAGVLVVEMEAAAIFAVARVRGIRSALIVAVSDELSRPAWTPGFGDERYADALLAARRRGAGLRRNGLTRAVVTMAR